MTRQSLAAFRRTIEIAWPQQRDKDAKALLIKVSREGISQITREQTSRAGVPPSVTTYANQPGRPIEQVVLPGPVVGIFDYRREIVEVGLDLLRKASPVQSGRYRDSHVVLLNGVQVGAVPANLKPTDELILTNPVPYSRRLEIGKTKSGRDFVLKVEPRIYERTCKQRLIPKYRNVASVTFGYLELSGAHVIKGGLSPSYLIDETRKYNTKLGAKGTQKRRLRRQQVGQAIKAPAIFIKALQ